MNGRNLGAAVTWLACDLAGALSGGGIDLVVSNPPYVAARDKPTLQREVRDYEPEVALYGGDDGMAAYRRLVPEAERLLEPGGWLVMEIGATLGDAVNGIIGTTNAWQKTEIRNYTVESAAGPIQITDLKERDGIQPDSDFTEWPHGGRGGYVNSWGEDRIRIIGDHTDP